MTIRTKYIESLRELGLLVEEKNEKYGNAYPKITLILQVLYPQGIPTRDYDVLPKLERTIEKLCRVSAGHRDDVAIDMCGIWLNQLAEELEREANLKRVPVPSAHKKRKYRKRK